MAGVLIFLAFSWWSYHFVHGFTVDIKVAPENYTFNHWLRRASINVFCGLILGPDDVIAENTLDVELYKDGGRSPIAYWSNHDNGSDGRIHKATNTMKVGMKTLTSRTAHFNVIISWPPTQAHAGTYGCSLSQYNQSGLVTQDSASRNLSIEPAYFPPANPYEDFETICLKYCIFVYTVIGIPGNVICFLVWIQKDMQTSSGIYLAVVALTDLFYVCLSLVYNLHLSWDINTLDYPVWCPIFAFLAQFSRLVSLPLALGFTVERYISICYPLKRIYYCTVRRAKIVTAGLIAFTIAAALPYTYYFHIEPFTGKCVLRKSKDLEYENNVFKAHITVINLLLKAVCSCVILSLNVLVIVKVKQRTQLNFLKREDSRESSKSTNRKVGTHVLLTLSFYQILTTLPYTILEIVSMFLTHQQSFESKERYEREVQNYYLYLLVYVILNVMSGMHYTFDFIIFVLTGKRFRQTLKRILTCPVTSRHNLTKSTKT